MQNKAKVKIDKMTASSFDTSNYENKRDWTLGENKPNSKPMSKQLVGAKPRWPESAKMAQIVANRGVITVQAESIKKLLKKPNLLTIKMLSSSHQPILATGTSFAHLVGWIHSICHSRASGNPLCFTVFWIPVFTGMTFLQKRKERNYG